MSKVISAIVSILLLVAADQAAHFWKRLHAQNRVDIVAATDDAGLNPISATTPIHFNIP